MLILSRGITASADFATWRITLRSLGACVPKRFGTHGRRRVFLWRYHGLSPWGSINTMRCKATFEIAPPDGHPVRLKPRRSGAGSLRLLRGTVGPAPALNVETLPRAVPGKVAADDALAVDEDKRGCAADAVGKEGAADLVNRNRPGKCGVQYEFTPRAERAAPADTQFSFLISNYCFCREKTLSIASLKAA